MAKRVVERVALPAVSLSLAAFYLNYEARVAREANRVAPPKSLVPLIFFPPSRFASAESTSQQRRSTKPIEVIGEKRYHRITPNAADSINGLLAYGLAQALGVDLQGVALSQQNPSAFLHECSGEKESLSAWATRQSVSTQSADNKLTSLGVTLAFQLMCGHQTGIADLIQDKTGMQACSAINIHHSFRERPLFFDIAEVALYRGIREYDNFSIATKSADSMLQSLNRFAFSPVNQLQVSLKKVKSVLIDAISQDLSSGEVHKLYKNAAKLSDADINAIVEAMPIQLTDVDKALCISRLNTIRSSSRAYIAEQEKDDLYRKAMELYEGYRWPI